MAFDEGTSSQLTLEELEREHGRLDSMIAHPTKNRLCDAQVTHLKKRKLRLKEQIVRRSR